MNSVRSFLLDKKGNINLHFFYESTTVCHPLGKRAIMRPNIQSHKCRCEPTIPVYRNLVKTYLRRFLDLLLFLRIHCCNSDATALVCIAR